MPIGFHNPSVDAPPRGRQFAAGYLPILTYLYSRVPFLLQRADQITSALFAAENGREHVTQHQFQILYILSQTGPLTQAGLARFSGADTSTVSLVTKNLVKAGYISRTGDPADRRQNLVTTSAIGCDFLKIALPAFQRAQERVQAPLGASRARFLQILEKISMNPSTPAPEWHAASLPSGRALDCGLSTIFRSPYFLIRRCLQIMEATMAKEVGIHNPTLRQYAALLLICFYPGVGESGMTRLLGVDASNAALIFRRLTGKGLIQSDAVHARGRKRYHATPAGRAAIGAIEPSLASRVKVEALAMLSAEEIADLQKMLGHLIVTYNREVRSPLGLFAEVMAEPGWPMPLQPRNMNFQTLLRDAAPEKRRRPEPAPAALRASLLKSGRIGTADLLAWSAIAVEGRGRGESGAAISPGQCLALALLREAGDMTAADLAQALSFPPQSLAGLLRPLIGRALIERRAGDRRRQVLSLLPAGTKLLTQAEASSGKNDAALFGNMSDREIHSLRQALVKFLRARP